MIGRGVEATHQAGGLAEDETPYSAAAEIAKSGAELATEIARNSKITRALCKVLDLLRELTSPMELAAYTRDNVSRLELK